MNDLKRKLAALIIAVLAVVLIGVSVGALLNQTAENDNRISEAVSAEVQSDDAPSQEGEGVNESNKGNSDTSNELAKGGSQVQETQKGSSVQNENANKQTDSGSSDARLTVSVQVVASEVNQPFSYTKTVTLSQGASVYDALCKTGLSASSSSSSYGMYIKSINGLAEKQYGGNSGWMFSVNGTTPMTSCSNYLLKEGDSVVWYYVQ